MAFLSSDPYCKYDVFVSFRGTDTRKSFTDHLFTALDRNEIVFFKEDEELEKGKSIATELLKAIEESRFALIVFSRNYASSSRCLDELVKIVECRKTIGQTVVPIFYDVNPSEVRDQTGSFEKAFADYEENLRIEAGRVQRWRAAMTEVANLAGWELQDWPESIFIQEIVKYLASKLSHSFSSVVKNLVGMDRRLKEMELRLNMCSNNVRMIGICGMGGIGKTTLARVVFDMFSHLFEGSTFLANIKEESERNGLHSLEKHLLSEILKDNIDVYGGISAITRRLRRKKVLIILDDVDTVKQLETLAGDREWFGPGSRVIITTRDEHLLTTHGVDEIYKAAMLNSEEAYQLLTWKAFKQNQLAEDYVKLSKDIVSYAGGLPLALEVLGSFLHGKSVDEWRNALKRLREIPNRHIFDILKISYDGLEETEKKIFLDIACFFQSMNVNRVINILDYCDFYPVIGIRVLVDKSLVSIDNDRFWMHALINEMGRAIVRQEKEPGKRSRLWQYNDIHHVLTKNTGTEEVECIYLSSYERKEIRLDGEAFSKMSNLRLLKIHNVYPSRGLDFLPSELRILKWHGCPLKSLPSSFKPEKLLQLSMCHSHIQQLWIGTEHSYTLKVIKLSHSKKLTKTPDFRGIPNLERLILEGCTNLCEVHPSIGDLKRLVLLNLKDCRNLRTLPSSIFVLKSLKFLNVHGCTKVDRLPENLENLECLEELDVGKTALRQLPSSIILLKNLKKLSFSGCKGQSSNRWNSFLQYYFPRYGQNSIALLLPSSLSGLQSLTHLDLSDCSLSDGELPNDFVHLSALKTLNLSRNNFVSLPKSISQLSQLQALTLEYCQSLQELPQLPSSIEDLRTKNCSSLKTISTPLDISRSRHREFWLNNCFDLIEHHGNDNVILSILKSHLFALMKIRLQALFPNFFKLSENIAVNVLLTAYLKSLKNIEFQEGFNPPSVVPKLIIHLPGSRIPEWFTHQGTSSSVIIELPQYWYNDFMFMGLAICGLFQVHENSTISSSGYKHPFVSSRGAYYKKGISTGNQASEFILKFYLHSDRRGHLLFGTHRGFSKDAFAATSGHLCVLFLPFDEYLQKNNWRHVEAHFGTEGTGFEFKQCGVRFVYLKDALELNQSTLFEGINIPQFLNLGLQILNFDQTAVVGPAIEPSHDAHHNNDEAGSSGTASSDHEEAHTTAMEE